MDIVPKAQIYALFFGEPMEATAMNVTATVNVTEPIIETNSTASNSTASNETEDVEANGSVKSKFMEFGNSPKVLKAAMQLLVGIGVITIIGSLLLYYRKHFFDQHPKWV